MKYIALTIGGHYVRCGLDGTYGLPGVYANGTGLGDDSIFERIQVGPGRVVLHPLSGGFLQARPDHTLAVNPDGYEVWETFEEIEWPGDRFSLRTWQRRFVCAEKGGGGAMIADRTEAGEWERFYYEVPPAGFLPPEPAPEQRPGVHDTIGGGPRRLGTTARVDVVTASTADATPLRSSPEPPATVS